MTLDESYQIAEELLGPCGVMLDGDKQSYRRKNPKSQVVHNGNVCIVEGKLWYGDIDVTRQTENLKALAKRLDTVVFVLHEHDARFSNEAKPLLQKAVASF